MPDVKPKFDPSQPFQAVDSGLSTGKPPFNPSLPFETPSEQPSMTEAAIRGGIQGLTSNFSDEAVGGLGAAGSAAIHLDPSLEHLKQRYQELRDLERQKNDAAMKAHPSMYRGADLGGAVAQGFLLPTSGLVGPITKSMSAAEKILQGAKIGGTVGGIAGLGSSNADLTQGDVKGAANDATTGAATGAAFGGLLQGGVEGVKGGARLGGRILDNVLSRYKPTQIISKATQKGLEGTDLTSLEPHLNALEDTSKELASRALQTKTALQNDYTSILDDAEKAGNKVDLNNFLDRLDKLKAKYKGVKDPEVQKEIGLIDDTIKNYTEGMPTEVENVVPYTKLKLNPAVPSGEDRVQEIINKELEKNRILGNGMKATVQKSEDGKLLTPMFSNAQTPEIKVGTPIPNTPAIPKSYTGEPAELMSKSIERQGGSPELDAKDVFKLQKLVGEKSANVLKTNDARQFGKLVDTDLAGEAEKAIPELPDMNKKYSAMSSALELLGLDANDSLIKNVRTGELELNPKALGKIQQFIKANAEDSLSSNRAQQALKLVTDNLEAAGLNTDALRKQIGVVGENFDLAKDIAGKGIHARLPVVNTKNLSWMGNFLGQQVNKAGNQYSKAAPALIGGEAQERASHEVQMPEVPNAQKNFVPPAHSVTIENHAQQGENVYDTTDNNLNSVAQKLRSTPGMEFKADSLEKAMQNNNQAQKNAIIFTLMQNPTTRKLLQKGQ